MLQVQPPLSPNYPVIWSAVAATFSALSSWLIWRTQRRNLLESVRPEIMLDQWVRRSLGEAEHKHEQLIFSELKNIGRGSALHLYVRVTRSPYLAYCGAGGPSSRVSMRNRIR
jgi:hypothetical protein